MTTIDRAFADRQIERSIDHNEIVNAEWSLSRHAAIQEICDDSVAADDETMEFWGTDANGSEWRVHLTGPRRVEGGEIADDYDTGRVVSIHVIVDKVMASIAWDRGGRTTVGADELRAEGERPIATNR